MINLLYIAFEVKLWPFNANNGFALRNSLFADVKLTAILILIRILILDMVFNLIYVELFKMPNGGFGKNVIIFVADMSSSAHADNKKRYLNSS